jgi:hypothetical protein
MPVGDLFSYDGQRCRVQDPTWAADVVWHGPCCISSREADMTRHFVISAIVMTLVAGLGFVGCDKGPLQKAGEKVDEVTGQDRLIGRGPAEKTGRKIDNTVDDVKK